ncbi:MAG: DUF4350 domain-containing protein, partial [Pseudomonadota bacterium]
MSQVQRSILFTIIGLLVVGGASWWWFENFEKYWFPKWQLSTEARENPMLAATRLLSAHQFTVKVERSFGVMLLQQIPPGTLILANNNGVMQAEQAKQVLDWVKQGNTLMLRPQWLEQDSKPATEIDEKEAKDAATLHGIRQADVIGSHLGVTLKEKPDSCGCKAKDDVEDEQDGTKVDESEDEEEDEEDASEEAGPPPEDGKKKSKSANKVKAEPSSISLPRAAYALQIDADFYGQLHTIEPSKAPLFADLDNASLRVYAEGKGHIVVMANNYFINRSLAQYDHAELLLGLAQLHPHSTNIVIVPDIDMPPWYQVVWSFFKYGVIALTCALLLLLWRALRRFGPVLPEPEQERRALIEHIDASARWLWKLPDG